MYVIYIECKRNCFADYVAQMRGFVLKTKGLTNLIFDETFHVTEDHNRGPINVYKHTVCVCPQYFLIFLFILASAAVYLMFWLLYSLFERPTRIEKQFKV